jgi:putative ABC transport system permease protein
MKKETLIVAWFLALKTMLKNKKTLLIISLVLTMSFISLTFVGAIINGLAFKFEDQVINGATGYVLIEPNDDEKYINNANNLQQKIDKLPLTVSSAKRIKISGSLETDEISLSKTITGIDPIDESKVTSVASHMVEGSYLEDKDMNEVIIGASLVKSYTKKAGSTKLLDVKAGDNIDIYFNNGIHETFNIKGIYRTGASFNDQEVFITNKKFLEIYPDLKDDASEISIKLPARGFEQEYKSQLISAISVRDKISDWTEKTDKIEQFTGSLIMVNSVMYIMGLLTAIATIYIIIYIDVIHKRKQIGILKAVGIKGNAIMMSFVIQAFIYGLIGVFFGLLVIYGMQNYFDVYPMKMSIGPISMLLDNAELLQSSLLLIGASVFAGLLPAYNAAKENILDAIFGG